MLQQPLARKGGGALAPVSRSYQTPAPTGGWNTRDGIDGMPVTDAPILKNWFPGTSRTRVRRGCEEYATSLASDVETLLTYSAGDGEEFFAAADEYIYDVSAAGSAAADIVVSALANARWQYTNIGNAGGRFLIGVNGADTPIKYDGSAWGTTTISGSTSTNFIHINLFKRRLFFTIKESLKFAYLGVEAIAGTAAEFDLAPVCQLGGYLMAMGTWTRDGGDGLDDLAVFYTSNGEIILYQGSDPSDANDWSMIGRFVVGRPLGRRCMERIGGELVLLSEDGFDPIGTALIKARATKKGTLGSKIQPTIEDSARRYGTNFGWQGVLYPRGSMMLFNVPKVEGELSEQYVANTLTGAWCQFTGWNANCFGTFNGNLYFGGAGKVFKADSGFSDNGMNIDTDVQQAPSHLGSSGTLKAFRMIRPVLSSDAYITPAIIVNVDYETKSPVVSPGFVQSEGTPWDTFDWNTRPWTVGAKIIKDWQSVEGIGYVAAIRMKIAVNGFEVFWNSTDWLFEPGGLQ
jgi:hypothetical protein